MMEIKHSAYYTAVGYSAHWEYSHQSHHLFPCNILSHMPHNSLSILLQFIYTGLACQGHIIFWHGFEMEKETQNAKLNPHGHQENVQIHTNIISEVKRNASSWSNKADYNFCTSLPPLSGNAEMQIPPKSFVFWPWHSRLADPLVTKTKNRFCLAYAVMDSNIL